LMRDANYWNFSFLMLQTETFAVRANISELIGVAIKNLMLCNGYLEDYLTEGMVIQLGQGLESASIDIVRANLKNFILIFTYASEHEEETEDLVRWIDRFDIDTGLENMVQHQCHDLRQMAEILVEQKRKLKRDEREGGMQVESC
jgi:hypothetical protein